MNFGRVFASAVARRVAFVLVAVVMAWLGIGRASAQACSTSVDDLSSACASEPSAYSAVHAAASARIPQMIVDGYPGPYLSQPYKAGNTWNIQTLYGAGVVNRTYSRSFPAGTDCASRSSETTLFYPPSGSVACNNGCAYQYLEAGDGETTVRSPTGGMCIDKPDCAALAGNYVWNGYLNVCQPVVPECPEGHEAHGTQCVKEDSCPDGMVLQNGVCVQKEDTCPPGNIRSPEGACLPGEGQCAAGEARRPNGTCGKDSDGDGEADDDDDNPDNDTEKPEARGGDTCDAPPSCSGDAIACMQVKIQWRIDCNTRSKANISGGHCGAGGMPVCSGDGCKAAEHAQLIQQWKSACLLEKIAKGEGESSGDGQPNWTKVTGTGKEGEGDEPDGPVTDREFDPTGKLDYSGFSGGGSCPQLGVLNLPFGKTFDMNALPWFCDLLYMTRMFLALLGTFIALGIVLGWRL